MSGAQRPEAPAFEKVTESLIYQGRIFKLVDEVWRSPDGEEFDRQVIRNRGAVAVLPLHDDGTVTLIHQFRPAFAESMWEIPAGLLDKPGESRPDAAHRELREEVGFTCSGLQEVVTIRPAAGLSDERTTVFIATGLEFVGLEADGPEEQYLHIERMPLADAHAMVLRGEIEDAKTVVAIMFAVSDSTSVS